jgi:hypothetical protein
MGGLTTGPDWIRVPFDCRLSRIESGIRPALRGERFEVSCSQSFRPPMRTLLWAILDRSSGADSRTFRAGYRIRAVPSFSAQRPHDPGPVRGGPGCAEKNGTPKRCAGFDEGTEVRAIPPWRQKQKRREGGHPFSWWVEKGKMGIMLSHISKSRCGAPVFCTELKRAGRGSCDPSSQNRDVGHRLLVLNLTAGVLSHPFPLNAPTNQDLFVGAPGARKRMGHESVVPPSRG